VVDHSTWFAIPFCTQRPHSYRFPIWFSRFLFEVLCWWWYYYHIFIYYYIKRNIGQMFLPKSILTLFTEFINWSINDLSSQLNFSIFTIIITWFYFNYYLFPKVNVISTLFWINDIETTEKINRIFWLTDCSTPYQLAEYYTIIF